jgi:glycosyltransferase involved in cell wall biosynthesis
MDPKVKMAWAPSLAPGWAPVSDAAVATAWMTAEWLAGYPPEKGRKYYLIQHLESTFSGADPDRVTATWRLPLKKIVIARWLEEIARGMGEEATYIPNGLNFETFGLDNPIPERDARRLIMLYHSHDWKGSGDGLAAMEAVRREIPGLAVTLFGIPRPPTGIPDWVRYVRNPSQKELRRLYNEAAVFVGPSWKEGWPLPPAEAAQCGAALCLTDIGGHREYAIPDRTALLSPARDPDALSRNILRLVRDPTLRVRIASAGNDYMRRFTWERAVAAMETCLKA